MSTFPKFDLLLFPHPIFNFFRDQFEKFQDLIGQMLFYIGGRRIGQ
ncbi:hypothetical protein A33Q_1041 [Indibacter alkaliphilus LW1]|uniref:Uncharacterized protein n=1 Tax=Indibacter alkaliphilus (strain CCUG 57479 / KCTC 22604 / LW1) TaxID=1189612 RepID=S2DH91_INDAL|nr:hypothetical protein A33Q_1041 [Indibacter alkaliphilus LW1]